MSDGNAFENLPPGLLWLADAPMFVDDEQIKRFYDASSGRQTPRGL